jgi:hypothetical protein
MSIKSEELSSNDQEKNELVEKEVQEYILNESGYDRVKNLISYE